MPNSEETQVLSGEQAPVSTTPEMQGQQAPVADATPATPQTDADVQALKKQLEQYEQDIRNIKSLSDRKLYEANQQWQQKENELRRQVEETKLSSMDEDARAKYVQDKERERLRDLESRVSKADTLEAEKNASLQAIKHFSSLGVPIDQLIVDKGYDALFQSGYAYLTADYQKLKEKVTQAPALPPQAPAIAKTSGSVPNLKPTWKDLIAKYGSEEAVYRGVESGRLDPSLIPTD
jgi:hypothetical protein